MKPAFLSKSLTAALALSALATTVGAQTVCMDTREMEAALKDWYGEAPVENYAGQKQQVWASAATGSWTVVKYLTDGNSCVVEQGENWPDVAEKNETLAALEQ